MNKKIIMAAFTIALSAALVSGATMAWFTDQADAGTAEFTAGTVSIDANASTIYGVEYKSPENTAGSLYEIAIDNDNNTVKYAKLYDSTKTALNALANDKKNKRLYYADGTGNLYFYDFMTRQGDRSAGRVFTVNTRIYDAAFGLGCYWFIPESTDDLYKVSFNADGTKNQVILVKANFTGGQSNFNFGDIAMDMKDGIIFGSTNNSSGNPKIFFSYNVYTGVYEPSSGDATNLQLAFGADGNLYGTETREFTWYRVDEASGTKTWFYKSDKMFGDLASNYQSNWNPGDSDIARYYIKNTGSENIKVRAIISGSWENALDSGNVDITLAGDMDLAKWIKKGNEFYYRPDVAPGESIELSVWVNLSGPATGNDYQGKSYELNPTFEAIQASNFAPYYEWDVDYYGVPTT